jgi:hypothetical protein
MDENGIKSYSLIQLTKSANVKYGQRVFAKWSFEGKFTSVSNFTVNGYNQVSIEFVAVEYDKRLLRSRDESYTNVVFTAN